MSDLQLGLIALGALVVIGVYLFNQLQTRQLNRRLKESARQPRVDVRAASDGDDGASRDYSARTEPRIILESRPPLASADQVAEERSTFARGAALAMPSAVEPPLMAIEFACRIDAVAPIAPLRINDLVRAVSSIGKPVRIWGCNAASEQWIALPVEPAPAVNRLAVGVQLANRAGPVNRVQLSTFRDVAQRFADEVEASCACGDVDAAVKAAADLDRFCAEVDISLGCNVMPMSDGGLTGTKLRGLLESAGFVLEQGGRFTLRTDEGTVLLTAEDMSGEVLTPERMRQQPMQGLTLTMDVPRAPNGGRVFDRMFEISRHLAQALDAVVVDDNSSALTDAGLKVIRQQLRDVHAAMDARGIPAGSATAERLFS